MLNYTSTRKKTVDHINSTAGNVKSVLYDNGMATIEYEKGAVVKLPIKAGSGIVIDADETGKGLEIHTDGGSGGANVYLCTTGGDATTYGNTISFVIVTSKTLTDLSSVKDYFNDNDLTSMKPYPCSGYYKYGGGGVDSGNVGLVWWNVPNLEYGYFDGTSYNTGTISSLTITKLI